MDANENDELIAAWKRTLANSRRLVTLFVNRARELNRETVSADRRGCHHVVRWMVRGRNHNMACARGAAEKRDIALRMLAEAQGTRYNAPPDTPPLHPKPE